MRQTMAIAMMVTMGLAACGKKDKDKGKGGDTTAKGGKGGKKTYAALTAEAALENITPADKPPFESIVFKMKAERDKGGFPSYDLYNVGNKIVTFAAVYVYAYDKDGKQVARNETVMSWNGKVEPGKKSDWAVEVESFKEGVVPESATSFDPCFTSIKFDGDTEAASDNARCPDSKAKGK